MLTNPQMMKYLVFIQVTDGLLYTIVRFLHSRLLWIHNQHSTFPYRKEKVYSNNALLSLVGDQCHFFSFHIFHDTKMSVL